MSLREKSKWVRQARVDTLTVGDFITIHDHYGEVREVNGPHGPLGTPPSTDWYTLRVSFEPEPRWRVPQPPETVGPLRGDREVECWS